MKFGIWRSGSAATPATAVNQKVQPGMPVMAALDMAALDMPKAMKPLWDVFRMATKEHPSLLIALRRITEHASTGRHGACIHRRAQGMHP
eukprot:1160884-Pelagomonas_calceolata.AAC.18